MGIMGHGDWLRGKYLTALITDHNDRAHSVQIRHVVGEYFLAPIENNLYAFSMRGARKLTIGDAASRQSRFIMYDTSNAMPLDTAKLDQLARTLDLNGLTRMDGSLLRLWTLLGRAEAKQEVAIRKAIAKKKKAGAPLTKHEVAAVMSLIDTHAETYPEEAEELRLYMKELDPDHIVGPVKRVVDYVIDELITTDPSFLGELCSRHARIDRENKTMTNTPRNSGAAWVKWGMLLVLGIAVVGFVAIGASEGWFDTSALGFGQGLDLSNLGSAFNPSSLGQSALSPAAGPDCSAAGIQSRYASPLDMAIAVESGAETCELPKEIKDALKHVEVPRIAEATPAPAPAP